jgi:hypothetical protein
MRHLTKTSPIAPPSGLALVLLARPERAAWPKKSGLLLDKLAIAARSIWIKKCRIDDFGFQNRTIKHWEENRLPL